jgi:hypothetical protein
MIPSGYKEDTVFSAIPTDGSGDLSFTRASNGTRVNSAGLVEVCPWNLAQYSEDLTNGYWQKINVTISSNTTVAPNGTTTADTFTNSSTGYGIFAVLDVIPSQQYTFSFYIKKGTNTSYLLSVIDGSTFTSIASLDYSSQVSATDWVRITQTFTVPSSTTLLRVYQMRDGSTTGTAFLWGAQVNIGSTAKPYFPTTDRLNVPRLTYQNGGGGCPSLLLEKQSTNSVFPSEDFSGYSGSAATISTNQATSPDGTTNADLIYPATSGNFAGKYKNIAKSTTGVVSCFVKQASKRYAIIGTDNNATYTCIFDLQTATVVYQATNYTGKIESFGNGWYRISAVYTSSTAADYPFIGVADNSSGGVVVDGTNGLYIWGFQYELNSSYPTSYIPTTSASATRVADACFKTGISSLIGQTEGVLFVDFNITEVEPDPNFLMVANLSDNSTANRLGFARNPNAGIHIYVIASSTSQFTFNTTQTTGRFKLAITYKANDYAIYLNGTSIYTNTSAPVPNSMSRFDLGNLLGTFQSKCTINQAVLFKTRLTNAELASLTTI